MTCRNNQNQKRSLTIAHQNNSSSKQHSVSKTKKGGDMYFLVVVWSIFMSLGNAQANECPNLSGAYFCSFGILSIEKNDDKNIFNFRYEKRKDYHRQPQSDSVFSFQNDSEAFSHVVNGEKHESLGALTVASCEEGKLKVVFLPTSENMRTTPRTIEYFIDEFNMLKINERTDVAVEGEGTYTEDFSVDNILMKIKVIADHRASFSYDCDK